MCFFLLDFCTIIPKVLLLKLFRHFGWCAEPLENFDPCLYFPFLPPLSRIKEASTLKPGNLFKFLLSKSFHTAVGLFQMDDDAVSPSLMVLFLSCSAQITSRKKEKNLII